VNDSAVGLGVAHQSPKAPAASSTVHVPQVSVAAIRGVVNDARIALFALLSFSPGLCRERGTLPRNGEASREFQPGESAREQPPRGVFRNAIDREEVVVEFVADRSKTLRPNTELGSTGRRRSAMATNLPLNPLHQSQKSVPDFETYTNFAHQAPALTTTNRLFTHVAPVSLEGNRITKAFRPLEPLARLPSYTSKCGIVWATRAFQLPTTST
jgi:hypothetical protein